MMADTSWLQTSLVYLCAAVVAVPLSRLLGLGSILGYLAAGMAIGPWGLRLVTDAQTILHVAEFGVVLMMFLVGLELQPRRLWAMRGPIFGWGSVQLFGSAALLTALGVAGFRIDAAKHMSATDVEAIIGRLDGEPLIISEVIRGGGEPIQPEDYLDAGAVFAFQVAKDISGVVPGGAIAKALEFRDGEVPSEQAFTFVRKTEETYTCIAYLHVGEAKKLL